MARDNYILDNSFELSRVNEPYSDKEYLDDNLALVAMRLNIIAECKTIFVAQANNNDLPPILSLPGSKMELNEALNHLLSRGEDHSVCDDDLAQMLQSCQEYMKDRIAINEAQNALPEVEVLCRRLQLDSFGRVALFAALACEIDSAFAQVFIELHGNERCPWPTLGTLIDICSAIEHPPSRPEALLLSAHSLAARIALYPVENNCPTNMQRVALRPATLSYLLHERHLSQELMFCSEWLTPIKEKPLFVDTQLSLTAAGIHNIFKGNVQRICMLIGARGSGRKSTLKYLSQKLHLDMLLIQLDKLPDLSVYLAEELAAQSWLWGTLLCIETNYLNSANLQILTTVLKEFAVSAIIITLPRRSNYTPDGYRVTSVEYSMPTLEHQLEFWQLFGAEYSLPHEVTAQMAAKYTLTAGRIKEALALAQENVSATGSTLESTAIDKAILLGNTGKLSEIADFIPVVYSWENLVLGNESKTLLRDICNRIKYRQQVELYWEFGRKSAYGNGLSVLLYGPPGTGKTMSAQVIAGELGLPLYRINLAQIISKYIGETAKNLDTIFNEARTSNVILFFDEADSLFAKRTDVKNSNDRHANSESSYLLQKIEEYSGISILATNLVNNFDEAFRRRIQYMVHIPMPSAQERLLLWQSMVPNKAPIDQNVDFKFLSENLDISGSVIKSSMLQAAYFAAADGAKINMKHIARAVQRELQKLGKTVPHLLQIYSTDEVLA